ncbi:hypothetical protein [uncultured Duncaniella sp.]|uniref:hypothetical protein n=1 Tax=uncultured Duncaniella sp. TaxID=2768039 RepID=UPI0026375FA8|nr:hypothetical protein [uncultured Duncaniella sp.]
MLIFADHMPTATEKICIYQNYKIEEIMTLNFSSPISHIMNTFELTPPGNLQSMYGYPDDALIDEQSRDMLYCRYLTENPVAFCKLMGIVCAIYESNAVAFWFVISHSEYRDDYANCFMKFLQTRYGLLSNEVSGPGDLVELKQAEFSLMGLANYQLDRERYLAISGIAQQEAMRDGFQQG